MTFVRTPLYRLPLMTRFCNLRTRLDPQVEDCPNVGNGNWDLRPGNEFAHLDLVRHTMYNWSSQDGLEERKANVRDERPLTSWLTSEVGEIDLCPSGEKCLCHIQKLFHLN